MPRKSSTIRPKLIRRFYEPLVLLSALGPTRGPISDPNTHALKDLAHLSLTDLKRVLLNELAYVCDYDKGGETVTALALQPTPQGYVFWVATNKASAEKIIGFLTSLLIQLGNSLDIVDIEQESAELAARCIAFATPRIKKYKSLLRQLLPRCIEHLTRIQHRFGSNLIAWLNSWKDERPPFDCCLLAYENRRSDEMNALDELSREPSYKTGKDDIHRAFANVRHYIGRLGYHFRAARVLLYCAGRFPNVVTTFNVQRVSALSIPKMPTLEAKITAKTILGRMLPADSPDIERYREALTHLDFKFHIFDCFRDKYHKPDKNPCVHAEIQVLEFFYDNCIHPGDDPFIACSKPACFCCALYFKHHPGNFAQPASHNKIYLNWRPPAFDGGTNLIGPNHQRDILNAMVRDIRKAALQQIIDRTPPRPWHPDSHTGISRSVITGHQGVVPEEVELMMSAMDDLSIHAGTDRSPSPLKEVEGWPESLNEGDQSQRDEHSETPSREESEYPTQDVEYDSDSSGGVPL